ncbi:hypothetical protein [Rosistilla oblonga]|uniref:hypothetical protein n=1 Tax=Rosistilla oblonga TaxID=2527990 RepID=UPI003A978C71
MNLRILRNINRQSPRSRRLPVFSCARRCDRFASLRSLGLAFLTLLVGFAGPALSDETDRWGDLTIRFVYDGIPPQPQRIADRVGEGFCGDPTMIDESLVVNTIDKGIRDLVVYAYQGPGGRALPAVHPDAVSGGKAFELANVNCNYVPRVLAITSGDALSVVNTDVIGYSTMLGFMANRAESLSLPPNARAELSPQRAEPAPIPVGSLLYPWMKARLLVLDHRYAGISDVHGRMTIGRLPAGVKLAFRVYHERASLRGLKIGGSEVNRRGVFELEIQPGENDLGTVSISAKRFGL